MPANLPPQYLEAEQRYREARTPQEKLHALKQMYAIMPKHKGTDKLQADIKRRISKLNEEIQHARKPGARRHTDYIRREGAGQVVFIGPPNSGKSSIIGALTHAEPGVAPYPFTTKKPSPAMMPYKDIQIQLVDMPPITEGYYEGWFSNVVRDCDLVLLVVGLDDLDPDGDIATVFSQFEGSGVEFTGEDVAGEDVPDYRTVRKKSILILNKVDLGGAGIAAELLRPVIGDIPVHRMSCAGGKGIDELRQMIYEALSIVRVYTKVPGKKPDMSKPYVVKRGTTILEIAAQIHKDFRDNLKFARVWGHAKYDGQPVEKGYILEDGDVIELHL
jgi:ribosome-interacting GTPase 1